MRAAVLGSGSAGNATCVEADGTRILIDAGFSCRELTARLDAVGIDPRRIDALVITHEHADHIKGAARFSTTYGVPVYCAPATYRAASLDRQGVSAHVPVEAGEPFAVGGLRLRPIDVPHDAVATLGFTIESNGSRLGYVTDLGHWPESVGDAIRDCDLLVLESNHDVGMVREGPYPAIVKDRVLGRHGHLDNETAALLACAACTDRTARLVLAHLSRTNNTPDLAIGAARAAFDRAGRPQPALHAAAQDAPSPWFEI
jgi:phosphoribosyl 1,2-cyclic phosphodiesterase